MNHMMFVLHSSTIQFLVERDLKLTWLLAIISPKLAKFLKQNKLNTIFLHYIFIIFCPFDFSETTYVISLFNLKTKL